MIAIRPETERLLDEVEKLAKRKFRYRKELGWLAEIAESGKNQGLFDEIVFLSKFATKSHGVLRREGSPSDDTAKLSREYTEAVQKVALRIQSLLAETTDDSRTDFTRLFFPLTIKSMDNFLDLLNELSWFKNYAIDKRGTG